MKTRLDVTVDPGLIEWVDGRIRDGRFASRSHAVQVALSDLRKKETVKL